MSDHQLLDAAGRPPVSGDDARSSRRPGPPEQGPPLPGRSPHGRRDRRRHAARPETAVTAGGCEA